MWISRIIKEIYSKAIRIKYILILSGFYVFTTGCYAQSGNVELMLNDIKILTEKGYIEFHCLVTVKPDVIPMDTMTYRWYNGKTVMKSQGGFSGRLLHGLYEEFLSTGNLIKQGEYWHGVKDGYWRTWDDKGRLSSVMRYDQGIPDGSCKKYSEGKLSSYCFYKDGRLHGKYIVYKGDTIYSEMNYKNGILMED